MLFGFFVISNTDSITVLAGDEIYYTIGGLGIEILLRGYCGLRYGRRIIQRGFDWSLPVTIERQEAKINPKYLQ